MAPQSNSASPWLAIKVHYMAMFAMFWFNIALGGSELGAFLAGDPVESKLSSALLYLFTAGVFLWFGRGTPVWSWLPFPMLAAAASVLLLKYDSHLFLSLLFLSWSVSFGADLKGAVFPWSGPCRMLFLSDTELDALAAALAKKT